MIVFGKRILWVTFDVSKCCLDCISILFSILRTFFFSYECTAALGAKGFVLISDGLWGSVAAMYTFIVIFDLDAVWTSLSLSGLSGRYLIILFCIRVEYWMLHNTVVGYLWCVIPAQIFLADLVGANATCWRSKALLTNLCITVSALLLDSQILYFCRAHR